MGQDEGDDKTQAESDEQGAVDLSLVVKSTALYNGGR